MNQETINLLAHKAEVKIETLNESKLKYLVLSMFAGMFVGFGCILIFTLGGYLDAHHFTATKLVTGLSFSFALTAIVVLGYELFTSNTMVMTTGALQKTVTPLDAIKIMGYSYVGNFIGAIVVSLLFVGTGLATEGATIDYFIYSASYKVAAPFVQLFFRGLLANVLVCAAVLSIYKTKDEMAQIALAFLLIFAFVASGFEHCIANMTTLLVCLFSPAQNDITVMSALHNIIPVTLGNIVGGAGFYGFLTYFMCKKKENKVEEKVSKAS